jgi:predicted nucleic-acid-binding protein
MPALDTNLLVRWLVDDDVSQRQRVAAVFDQAIKQSSPLWVPVTVALELEWVLRARYGYDKPSILKAFNGLLETRELHFHEEASLERALHLYRMGTADFADCLNAGLAADEGHAPLLTLDRKAARLPGVALMSYRGLRS